MRIFQLSYPFLVFWVVRKTVIIDIIITARVKESIYPACIWVLCNVPVGAPTVTGTARLFILAYCAELVKIDKRPIKLRNKPSADSGLYMIFSALRIFVFPFRNTLRHNKGGSLWVYSVKKHVFFVTRK